MVWLQTRMFAEDAFAFADLKLGVILIDELATEYVLELYVTYSTITLVNPSRWSVFLSTTNFYHASSISSLSNKEPMYVVLSSDSEDISVSVLHVRALCPVLLQFLQRHRAG
jgi:hypothetical protein